MNYLISEEGLKAILDGCVVGNFNKDFVKDYFKSKQPVEEIMHGVVDELDVQRLPLIPVKYLYKAVKVFIQEVSE